MPDKRIATNKFSGDSSGKSGKDKPDKTKRAKDKADKTPAPAGAAPEQQVGDTPTPPWEMPSTEQKAEARPVRSALRGALSEVNSPEKADAVVDELEAATKGLKVEDVAAVQPVPSSTAQAAKQVKEAEKTAPPGEAAQAVLAQTAAVLTAAKKPEREAVSQAAQEIFNAQQQGAATAVAPEQQDLLRAAVLKHLKPLDALDATLFLRINHLPHTPALNRFFYFFTLVFTGGTAWFVLMGVVTLFNRRLGLRTIREAALPLALATATVEHPIKAYFKRRRPFIDIIQAIVVGKKPGTWSFPSGHSATAFGGAWIFSHYLPRLSWLWYTIAGLTAFSRVYLGDHYPGDVVSGSVLGVLFSILYRMLPWPR
jgi:undecaprenyl-diphosphatase